MTTGNKHCPHCTAQLDVGSLPTEAAARCSDCGGTFLVSMMLSQADASGDTSLSPNRNAKLSLIFGLLSIATLTLLVVAAIMKLVPRTVVVGVMGSGASMLLGVLAMGCGVLGIRDGRRPDTQASKGRLIGGMLTGTVFGIACGTCGILLSVFLPGWRPSTDPADLAKAQAEIGSFEVPEGIEPVRTQVIFSIRHLRWEDEATGSEVNTTYYPSAFAMNEAAARSQSASMRSADLGDLPELSETGRYSVEVNGNQVEIVEESGSDDSAKYVYYSGFLRHTDGWVYARVTVTTDTPPPGADAPAPVLMTPEQVQRFFMSYTPPEK